MADDGIDVDGLAGKIAAAMGRFGGGSSGDDDDHGHRPRSVPYGRLQREIDKRKALEGALQDLGGQVESLKATYEGKLGKVREDTAVELKRIQGGHAEDLALVDAGVTDPLGRRAVRSAWSELPKDGRGKSAAEWWKGIKGAHEAHTADPEKAEAPTVPRTLQTYLPTGEAGGGKGGGGGKPRGAAPPAGPGKRADKGIESVPIDQGMEAFFSGLRAQG